VIKELHGELVGGKSRLLNSRHVKNGAEGMTNGNNLLVEWDRSWMGSCLPCLKGGEKEGGVQAKRNGLEVLVSRGAGS